jgi:hypothetical protein
MAAGDVKLVYGTAADATITLASLATSSTKLVGRESTAIDNSSTLALDYLISGKITTGTSPTTSKSIEIWAVASWDGTTYPAGFAGSDAAGPTLIAENKACLALVASMATVATSDTAYHFTCRSIASLFGGVVPKKFSFFVTHDTAVNLNSTAGNHQIRVQPIYENIAS